MKDYLKNLNWKDILERALWTFVEGALVALPVTFSMEMDGAAWKSLLFSAVLGGVSALKTFLLDIARQHTAKIVAEIETEEREMPDEIEIENNVEEFIPEEAYDDIQGKEDESVKDDEEEK